MNTAEFDAAYQEPQIILGLRLLPLSLGRYKLLKRFDNPFVFDEERKETLESLTHELFFGLIICGLPCKEFKQIEQSAKLGRQLKRWGKRVSKFIERERYFSILEKIEAFKRYLKDACEIPWEIQSRNSSSESSVVHWSTAIENILRSKLNWDDEKIDESPLEEAMTQYLTFMEGEGIFKLIDEETAAKMKESADENGAIFEKLFARK